MAYQCPHCGAVSYNPTDEKNRYCGRCHLFENDPQAKLIHEGRNQVLYLLLAIGDENVAHDHWHPDRAQLLLETRREIVKRLRYPPRFPDEYPDFEKYTYIPG